VPAQVLAQEGRPGHDEPEAALNAMLPPKPRHDIGVVTVNSRITWSLDNSLK
jgi:hypothetical protein